MTNFERGIFIMREINQPGNHSYVFSRYLDPIAKVKPGEEVVINADLDAFENRISKKTDVPSEILGEYLNPQIGPIYVEGAEPGDTLICHIIDIEATRDWAVSILNPFFGGLTATPMTKMLHDPLPEKVWIYDLNDGMLVNSKQLSFPWRPFMGTVATAPDLEAVSTL